ncbi:hypothetical protein PGS42_20710, partial [Yersinia kristensenii]|uniref:hypothetical protein n=1 Tax=Yersinia kristensenii TaxID=28152 RepID=UPI0022FEA652
KPRPHAKSVGFLLCKEYKNCRNRVFCMEFSVGFVFEEPNKREATLRVAFLRLVWMKLNITNSAD